jgi:DnaJ-domain-containing protein 1
MGQILNRIKNITKSYINDSDDTEKIINSDGDELSSIIDDLNSKKKKQENKKQNEKQQANASEAITMDKALTILGLAVDAGKDDIKSAYKKKIKEYHPDKVANMGEEIRDLAKKKTIEFNIAYSFLRKTKGF